MKKVLLTTVLVMSLIGSISAANAKENYIKGYKQGRGFQSRQDKDVVLRSESRIHLMEKESKGDQRREYRGKDMDDKDMNGKKDKEAFRKKCKNLKMKIDSGERLGDSQRKMAKECGEAKNNGMKKSNGSKDNKWENKKGKGMQGEGMQDRGRGRENSTKSHKRPY